MKDILDREIMVGDTLAYPRDGGGLGTTEVLAVAPFAMKIGNPDEPLIITQDDKVHYVICNFGYGV